MLSIPSALLPADEATLRAALVRYRQALLDHAKTVGVPAPWPEYDILRDILATGGEFSVEYPPPQTARELALKAIADKNAREAKAAEDRMLAAAALDPTAPQEVKDYVSANPDIAALAAPSA